MLTYEERKKIEKEIREIDDYLSGLGIEIYPDKNHISIVDLEKKKEDLIAELQYDDWEKSSDKEPEIY